MAANDTEQLQAQARLSMQLSADDVNAISVRILEHIRARKLHVPVLRLLHRKEANEWIAIPDVHRFYENFAGVVRHAEDILSTTRFSRIVSKSARWHAYCMGMFAHFRRCDMTWMVVATRVTYTPRAPKLDKTKNFWDFLRALVEPRADIVAHEYLICVDLGLSNLANIETNARRTLVREATLEAVSRLPSAETAVRPPPAPPEETRHRGSKSSSSSSSSKSSSSSSSESERVPLRDTKPTIQRQASAPLKIIVDTSKRPDGTLITRRRSTGVMLTDADRSPSFISVLSQSSSPRQNSVTARFTRSNPHKK